ncbi:hypothetical protein M422DRAFT_162204 [Sphaerobolus stellatus SS14]|nr:hypothetical protein M422DRAFT_162204 [Sphaerobolus stellatus SS14]
MKNLSTVRFADYAAKGLISPDILKGIPFEFCTPVQAETLDAILTGSDVLAQAKTGTGKTLAFLVPIVERLSRNHSPNGDVSALILSPTRELAQQIASEAGMLLRGAGLQSRLGLQVFVGGTNINRDVNAIKGRCDIVVATPGRLIDLIEQHNLRARLRSPQCFVLDEADRLLDSGFKAELEKIIAALPPRATAPRQTLFFSATFPASVQKIARLSLLPTHKHVSTLTAEDIATHEHVDQYFGVVPMRDLYPTVAGTLAKWVSEDPKMKVIIFTNTARTAGMLAEALENIPLNIPIYATHSRLSQPKREKSMAEFRKTVSAVLVSSDVTARGIDIPDITHVLQVGLPSNVEQYVHRLGRTARAGKGGSGTLLLADFEHFWMTSKGVSELGMKPLPMTSEVLQVSLWRDHMDKAFTSMSDKTKCQSYSAWLGYYKGSLRNLRMTPEQIVQTANTYAREVLRFQRVNGAGKWVAPGLLKRTIGKMGLRGVPGLNAVDVLDYDE